MRLKYAENLRNSRLKSKFIVSYKEKRVYCKLHLEIRIFGIIFTPDKNEYLFGYKGKATFWRPSWISGPKTQCSLHFKFGKHLQLFRQYNKVRKKYNQSCPPGGCNGGYYGILE